MKPLEIAIILYLRRRAWKERALEMPLKWKRLGLYLSAQQGKTENGRP
jgi:hypothetical protein